MGAIGWYFRGSEANIKLQIARTNLQHKLVYATACARGCGRGWEGFTCESYISHTIFYGPVALCLVDLADWADLALSALLWQECMQIAVTCRKFAFAAHRYE